MVVAGHSHSHIPGASTADRWFSQLHFSHSERAARRSLITAHAYVHVTLLVILLSTLHALSALCLLCVSKNLIECLGGHMHSARSQTLESGLALFLLATHHDHNQCRERENMSEWSQVDMHTRYDPLTLDAFVSSQSVHRTVLQ